MKRTDLEDFCAMCGYHYHEGTDCIPEYDHGLEHAAKIAENAGYGNNSPMPRRIATLIRKEKGKK